MRSAYLITNHPDVARRFWRIAAHQEQAARFAGEGYRDPPPAYYSRAIAVVALRHLFRRAGGFGARWASSRHS